MIPDLTPLTGESSHWLVIALRALAAMGFMAAANAVILYAC